jgi:hypothetical protein
MVVREHWEFGQIWIKGLTGWQNSGRMAVLGTRLEVERHSVRHLETSLSSDDFVELTGFCPQNTISVHTKHK